MTVEIVCADAREALAAMPEGSVHTCVTSPPYWGLRDYGLEPTVWGGDDGCEHEWGDGTVARQRPKRDHNGSGDFGETRGQEPSREGTAFQVSQGALCHRCNAWRGTLGLEPTPELYVEHIVEIFREVRRVLRGDGTLWLNLGDSYNAAGRDGHGTRVGYKQGTNRASANGADHNRPTAPSLKPKDLCGMPWRVAFALQSDGWWLRSDIIWSKPNPMPESVRDRPTRAHEYVFLLSKSQRYYYDADAIREPLLDSSIARISQPTFDQQTGGPKDYAVTGVNRHRSARQGLENLKEAHERGQGRNKRSVWEIATQPYPEAHFAVFPEKLVEPCILAGCPEGGTVLDPFAGSGTVGVVAERLGRASVLIDAKEEYCEMARERTAQRGLMAEAAAS